MKTLYDEPPVSFIQEILDDFNSQQAVEIYQAFGTKKGVENNANVIFPKKGIYCIYKKSEPIYIGFSNSSIHNRLGRFLAGVTGKEGKKEKHPAAYRYIKEFGNDTRGLTVKYFDTTKLNFPKYVKNKDIERDLIVALQPKFNIEVHKRRFVSKFEIQLL